MINIRLALLNPFHNEKKNPFKTIFQRTWIVFTHKELELGLFYYPYYWFEFDICTRFRGEDHAGPELEIVVFGWYFRIALQDTRHWNSDKNRWVNYDNEDEVKEWW